VKPGPRVVAAVGLGYLLGRTRKMRLALMIAMAGASGKFGGPRQLLQQGVQRLAASGELAKITDSLRGELMSAAKAAAMTAATSRIDSLNSRLQDQLSIPGQRHRDDQEPPEDEEIPEDEYDEDEFGEEEPEDEEAPRERSSSNGRRARAGASRSPVRRTRR
jgi:hypothetical protein